MQGLVPVGSFPELGVVPDEMHAQVIRPEHFGDPRQAFRSEVVKVPELGPRDVLVAVMAAGINYNNVWAARGVPVDIVEDHRRRGDATGFHIGGSDAAGIVYATGADVTEWTVGDEVVTHPGCWDLDDPWVVAGKDPMLASSSHIYGYETNYGSFGQFTRVSAHQCMPKPTRLTWEQAAASTLVGTTAYRMLTGWAGNTVQPDDVVLVWGGSGGVGVMATQIARHFGARPVAVVSGGDRGQMCMEYGALGFIDRTEFDHWGLLPDLVDEEAYRAWMSQARAFKKRIWGIVGERRDPAIVIEHPGQATIPTSVFSCAGGGMVVICAGTTGYLASLDLRYQWVQQKRLQGSHGTNDEQANAFNELVASGAVDPAVGQVLAYTEIPDVHYQMGAGIDVLGNRVALVGAPKPGLGASID